MDKTKFGSISYFKDLIYMYFKSYFKRFFELFKSLLKRYFIKIVTFIITNTLAAVFSLSVPVVGAIAYIIIFICLCTIEIPLFGFDSNISWFTFSYFWKKKLWLLWTKQSNLESYNINYWMWNWYHTSLYSILSNSLYHLSNYHYKYNKNVYTFRKSSKDQRDEMENLLIKFIKIDWKKFLNLTIKSVNMDLIL